MTLFVADVATYQGALSLDALRAAGFAAVNLKISHGLTRRSVHPDVGAYLPMAASCFHWLTGDADGARQAEYAYEQMTWLGLGRVAHVVDVEGTTSHVGGEPTERIYRDYLARFTELLRRPVVTYTGDWWQAAHPWLTSSPESPWLWAAPNAGYLPEYPGDASQAWSAGYGGWDDLSVMQYRVGPVTGIDVSQSAVRDPDRWIQMTGAAMSYAPQTLKDARLLWLDRFPSMDPKSMGIVGDDSHADAGTSYHLGKDALSAGAYSVDESPRDNRPTNAAMALDIGWFSQTIAGTVHNLRTFSAWLVARCKAGTADTQDIREVIYSTDGKTVKRWDRLGIRSTGPSSHLTHTHVSYFRDSESRNKTALYQRYFTDVLEAHMPLDAADKTYLTGTLVPAIAKAVAGIQIRETDRDLNTVLSDLFSGEQRATSVIAPTSTTYRQKQLARLEAAVKADEASDVTALAEVLAAVRAGQAVNPDLLAAALLPGLAAAITASLPESGLTGADVEQALRNVLLSGAAPDTA